MYNVYDRHGWKHKSEKIKQKKCVLQYIFHMLIYLWYSSYRIIVYPAVQRAPSSFD